MSGMRKRAKISSLEISFFGNDIPLRNVRSASRPILTGL